MSKLNVYDWNKTYEMGGFEKTFENILKAPGNFETLHTKKDNSEINVQINAKIIELNNKKYLYASQRDITQLKLLEDQSRLTSLGEMMGNIAHQWRQPLSVISMSVSGLKLKYDFSGGCLNEDEITYSVDRVMEQTQYLSKTIDDFKNFVKEDKEFKNLQIKELLDSTINLIIARVKNNFINLNLDIEDDLKIYGNKNELQQALINILNNSMDFIQKNIKDEDKKIIFISSHKIDENKLRLDITDTAGGIDEDIIKKIFDPYFTTKHQSVGTGLGLSMADKIIRQRHDFYIQVTNQSFEYNGYTLKGAKFSIYFHSN